MTDYDTIETEQVDRVRVIRFNRPAKLNAVNDVMVNSDQKIQSFVRGEETSIHEVMIAMSKADISFRMMSQVGRKVIEAYQEIMRMQV